MKLLGTLTMVLISVRAPATDLREIVADDLMSAGHARVFEAHRREIEGEPEFLERRLWAWAATSPEPALRRAALRALVHAPSAPAHLDDLFAIVEDAVAQGDEETARLALKSVGRTVNANAHEHHRLLVHYNGVKSPESKALYLDRADDLRLMAPETFPRELGDLLESDPVVRRKAFELGLGANALSGSHVNRLTHRMAEHLARIDEESELQERLNAIALRAYEGRALDPLIPVLRKLRGHHESESIRSSAEHALYLLRGAGMKASILAGPEAFGDLCRSLLVRVSSR